MDGTGGDYGPVIIKCKVNTSGFPATGRTERGGDGNSLVITDASVITPIGYAVFDLDDKKLWVDGKVGLKFKLPFPKPTDLTWIKA